MATHKPTVTRVVVNGLSYEQLQLSPKVKVRYPPRMTPNITYSGKTTHLKLTPGPRGTEAIVRDGSASPTASIRTVPTVGEPPILAAAVPSRRSRAPPPIIATPAPAPAPVPILQDAPLHRQPSDRTYRTTTTAAGRHPTVYVPSQRPQSIRSRSVREREQAAVLADDGTTVLSPTRSHFYSPPETPVSAHPGIGMNPTAGASTASILQSRAGRPGITPPPIAEQRIEEEVVDEGLLSPGGSRRTVMRKGHAPAYMFDETGELRAITPEEVKAAKKPSPWSKVRGIFMSKKKKKEKQLIEEEKNRPVSFYYAVSEPGTSVRTRSVREGSVRAV